MVVSPTNMMLSVQLNQHACSHDLLHAGSIPFNPNPEGSAFLAKIKGFIFYSFTLLLSVPLFISMLVMTPFVLLFDKYRYVQHQLLTCHCILCLWCQWQFCKLIARQLYTQFAKMHNAMVMFRRSAQHFVNNLWAKASTTPFYGVKVGSV